MQQLAQRTERRTVVAQDVERLVHHLAHGRELVRAPVYILDLAVSKLRGEAREAGEHQHKRPAQLGAALGLKHEWSHVEVAVGHEVNAIEAAIGRPYLILTADAFLKDFLLDADRFA